jgi:hypothetical protein
VVLEVAVVELTVELELLVRDIVVEIKLVLVEAIIHIHGERQVAVVLEDREQTEVMTLVDELVVQELHHLLLGHL